MTLQQTILLGFIAGSTIVLGLLAGRLHRLSAATRTFMNAVAIGILLFLTAEILVSGLEPAEHAVEAHSVVGITRTLLLLGGLGVGILGLVAYDTWSKKRRAQAGNSDDEFSLMTRMSVLIAIGMGLHNFGEGLAIGSSAHSATSSLTTVLVIGFALHNATEGFGIIGPLASTGKKVSWGLLASMALIGGGPTTLGSVVGWSWNNETVTVAFYALAAGSIIYVIAQLYAVAQRQAAGNLLHYGVVSGLSIGIATELVVKFAQG